jgi:hypothetical protein
MTERVYVRRLPGGGYVAIDITRVRRVLRRSRYRGAVVVERRAAGAADRTRHPLVVAEASGASAESVLSALLPAAECNPAIGSAVLRHTPGALPRSPIGASPTHRRAPTAVHA